MTSWQLSPAMWNIGAAEMITGCSAGGAHRGRRAPGRSSSRRAPLSIDASRKWMLLRCDSITPLGRPVVPLVKRMTNGSSSSMATSGNGASGACARARRSRPRTRRTGRPAGSSMPSRRSSRRRSPNSTFGSVSSTAYAISSPVHQPLSPTVIAPSAVVAQNVERVLDGVRRDDGDAVAGPDAVAGRAARRRPRRSAGGSTRTCTRGRGRSRTAGRPCARPRRAAARRATRPVGEHEHGRAEHVLPRAARTGAPGPVSVVRTDLGKASDGQTSVVTRGGAATSSPVVAHHQLRVLGA